MDIEVVETCWNNRSFGKIRSKVDGRTVDEHDPKHPFWKGAKRVDSRETTLSSEKTNIPGIPHTRWMHRKQNNCIQICVSVQQQWSLDTVIELPVLFSSMFLLTVARLECDEAKKSRSIDKQRQFLFGGVWRDVSYQAKWIIRKRCCCCIVLVVEARSWELRDYFLFCCEKVKELHRPRLDGFFLLRML